MPKGIAGQDADEDPRHRAEHTGLRQDAGEDAGGEHGRHHHHRRGAVRSQALPLCARIRIVHQQRHAQATMKITGSGSGSMHERRQRRSVSAALKNHNRAGAGASRQPESGPVRGRSGSAGGDAASRAALATAEIWRHAEHGHHPGNGGHDHRHEEVRPLTCSAAAARFVGPPHGSMFIVPAASAVVHVSVSGLIPRRW